MANATKRGGRGWLKHQFVGTDNPNRTQISPSGHVLFETSVSNRMGCIVPEYVEPMSAINQRPSQMTTIRGPNNGAKSPSSTPESTRLAIAVKTQYNSDMENSQGMRSRPTEHFNATRLVFQSTSPLPEIGQQPQNIPTDPEGNDSGKAVHTVLLANSVASGHRAGCLLNSGVDDESCLSLDSRADSRTTLGGGGGAPVSPISLGASAASTNVGLFDRSSRSRTFSRGVDIVPAQHRSILLHPRAILHPTPALRLDHECLRKRPSTAPAPLRSRGTSAPGSSRHGGGRGGRGRPYAPRSFPLSASSSSSSSSSAAASLSSGDSLVGGAPNPVRATTAPVPWRGGVCPSSFPALGGGLGGYRPSPSSSSFSPPSSFSSALPALRDDAEAVLVRLAGEPRRESLLFKSTASVGFDHRGGAPRPFSSCSSSSSSSFSSSAAVLLPMSKLAKLIPALYQSMAEMVDDTRRAHFLDAAAAAVECQDTQEAAAAADIEGAAHKFKGMFAEADGDQASEPAAAPSSFAATPTPRTAVARAGVFPGFDEMVVANEGRGVAMSEAPGKVSLVDEFSRAKEKRVHRLSNAIKSRQDIPTMPWAFVSTDRLLASVHHHLLCAAAAAAATAAAARGGSAGGTGGVCGARPPSPPRSKGAAGRRAPEGAAGAGGGVQGERVALLQAFALLGGLRAAPRAVQLEDANRRGDERAADRGGGAGGGFEEGDLATTFRPYLFQSFVLPFARALLRQQGAQPPGGVQSSSRAVEQLFAQGHRTWLSPERLFMALAHSLGPAHSVPPHLASRLRADCLIHAAVSLDDAVLKLLPVWASVDDARRTVALKGLPVPRPLAAAPRHGGGGEGGGGSATEKYAAGSAAGGGQGGGLTVAQGEWVQSMLAQAEEELTRMVGEDQSDALTLSTLEPLEAVAQKTAAGGGSPRPASPPHAAEPLPAGSPPKVNEEEEEGAGGDEAALPVRKSRARAIAALTCPPDDDATASPKDGKEEKKKRGSKKPSPIAELDKRQLKMTFASRFQTHRRK